MNPNQPKSHEQANRLIHEKSPYLLQHAYNPVDWFPWGDEAFAKAKSENKPIFLSIGYSTCHWCHVMEEESFENPEIAAILNECYVAIKVDREERPDIDGVYMMAVNAMTGQGGWPLSAFLTPERKPFFGGTYFPPEPRWGSVGFKNLLLSIQQSWQKDQTNVEKSGESLIRALQDYQKRNEPGELGPAVIDWAYQILDEQFDAQHGGFGQAPKFPMGHSLSFLLRYHLRQPQSHAKTIVRQTLDHIALGGINDQLGGGFHRYSTDARWQVAHFEKMLYDQALLTRCYAEAYQVTGEPLYRDVVRETLDYVLRDLRDEKGGFYSAEDADSLDPEPEASQKKKEGAFYLWTEEELERVLDTDELAVVSDLFSIRREGNAEVDPHAEFTGKNILHRERNFSEAAVRLQKSENFVKAKWQQAKDKLFLLRSRRPRPHLDDKILVSWNGLMIASLAYAGQVLRDDRYVVAAEKAAGFILQNLRTEQGRLLHRYRDSEAGIPGSLEDYAFFIYGLLELYEATFKFAHLQTALGLAKDMMDLFSDEKVGGFFFSAKDSEQLILAQKDFYDGALPSGNSVAAFCLVKLEHLTLDRTWRQSYEKVFQNIAFELNQRPSSYTFMLMAVDFVFGPSQEIVVMGRPDDVQVKESLRILSESFLPNRVIAFVDVSADQRLLQEQADCLRILKDKNPSGNPMTIYFCENQVCHQPIFSLDGLQNHLKDVIHKREG